MFDLVEGSMEQAAKARRLKVLNVLWIVAPMPDVLSSAKIAEAKEGLPRDRHDAAPMTDAGKFLYRSFGRFEVLENLEAGDHVSAAIGEWQHSGIRPYPGGGRKPLEGQREFVVPVFNSDQRACVYPHRVQRQAFANADIDPGTTGRTGGLPQFSQQTSNELSHHDVTAGVLCFVLSGCVQDGTGRQADRLSLPSLS